MNLIYSFCWTVTTFWTIPGHSAIFPPPRQNVYVGRRRVLAIDRRQGARFHLPNDADLKHFGLLQERWGDRHLWNEEEVETSVRNGSECNKPISTRTQNENAAGWFVVMSKCDWSLQWMNCSERCNGFWFIFGNVGNRNCWTLFLVEWQFRDTFNVRQNARTESCASVTCWLTTAVTWSSLARTDVLQLP